MKLGLLTACLPNLKLADVAQFAASLGIEALEVAAWPATGDRPFTASHLDVERLSPGRSDDLVGELATLGLSVSALAYYDNNLAPDLEERRRIHEHLHACIDAAALMGCGIVGTFVGRDPAKSVAENLREAKREFAPLVSHANDAGVRLAIENCVMEGWHPDGYPGNLAYSPELWEWMFSLGLYLNFDPSHLCWMGIDPAEAVRPYVDQVIHAQAKDIELFPERRNRYGYPGRAVQRPDPWDTGWWRYRIPGLGQVDWRRVLDVLYEGGFEGTVSIEHEDPVWGGTTERVQAGVAMATRTLRSVMAPVATWRPHG
ncbi:MAG: sugar phosphate isomerase/epimerase [Actinomycetota bacterium]|nr:sugar phosphate isomerase/epimerase [Actinomycetota bacterium]